MSLIASACRTACLLGTLVLGIASTIGSGGGGKVGEPLCGTALADPPPTLPVAEGGSVTYAWSAANAQPAPAHFSQWFRADPNGQYQAIPGATSDAYTFGPTIYQRDNGARFKVQVTWRCATETPTDEVGPMILELIAGETAWVDVDAQGRPMQPEDVTVAVLGTAHFIAMAHGANAYQWQRSNDDGATWTDVAGATDWAFDFVSVLATDDQALFRLRATDVHFPNPQITSRAARLSVTGQASCQQPGTTHSVPTINASERWTAAAGPHAVPFTIAIGNNAVLTIEAGALVCLGTNAGLNFDNGASLVAGAAGGPPVVFTALNDTSTWGGISLAGAPAQASSITRARIELASGSFSNIAGLTSPAVVTSATHTVTISDTLFKQITYTALEVRSPGSTIVRSTVDGTGGIFAFPKVKLSGSGIDFASRVLNAITALDIEASSVTVHDCEITGNQVGIFVGIDAQTVTGVSIHNCNLINNSQMSAGATLVNGSTVDATGNWWGSAAGPASTGPDSVFGSVDASQWLTAPVPLTY